MNADDQDRDLRWGEQEGEAAFLRAVENCWSALERGEPVDSASWADLQVRPDDLNCLSVVQALFEAARLVAEDSHDPDAARGTDGGLAPTTSFAPGVSPKIPLAAAEAPEARFAIGRRIGDYEIRDVLGIGGQAVTCKAWDVNLQRHVVLKLYHRVAASQDEERILNEGRKLARLTSSFAPRCYLVARVDAVPCLVLEYVAGMSLKERQKTKPLTAKESLELIARIAEGLAAVHACGLLHCDVKPENILLADDGVPRLIDFGLCKPLGDPGLAQAAGTFAYMAPEQARGEVERVGPRTDIFGIGATLYYLLTGSPPYFGKTAGELFQAARRGEIVPLSQRRRTVPAGAASICMRCLAKAPENRYEFATDVAKAIRQLGRNQRRRAEWAIAALLLLIAIAVGAAARWNAPGGRSEAQLDPTTAGVRGITRTPPDDQVAVSPVRIEAFDIKHFVNTPDGDVDVGILGRDSYATALGDRVQIQLRLFRPGYAYLIVFRPDGAADLCYPESEDRPPPQSEEANYPLANTGKAYGLREGSGLWLVAAVISQSPLPAYREWLTQRSTPYSWQPVRDLPSGMVWRDKGDSRIETLSAAGVKLAVRGKDEDLDGPYPAIHELLGSLRGPGTWAAAIGFHVLENRGAL